MRGSSVRFSGPDNASMFDSQTSLRDLDPACEQVDYYEYQHRLAA